MRLREQVSGFVALRRYAKFPNRQHGKEKLGVWLALG